MYVHEINDVGETDIHTAQLLVSKANVFILKLLLKN